MAMSPLAQAIAIQNAQPPAPQGQIQPANVLGAYQLASQVAEQNYQAKVQQMMGLWGGLASLGAAGILGYGKPLAGKLFGSAASPAASSVAPATTSGIDAATGGPVAASSTSWMAPADATAAADLGVASPAASSIAADYGLTGAGADAAAGSIAADLGGAGAAGAADLAGSAAADAGASSILDFLPILFA